MQNDSWILVSDAALGVSPDRSGRNDDVATAARGLRYDGHLYCLVLGGLESRDGDAARQVIQRGAKMPVPKRVTIAAISAALLACGAILCIPLVPHWHAYRFRRQDAAIRLGMDKGDVHAILGEPTSARGFVDEAEILALRRRGWNGDAKQLTRSIWIRVSRDGQVHGLALVFDGDTVLDKSRSD